MSNISVRGEDDQPQFRPFTEDHLAAIEAKIAEEEKRKEKLHPDERKKEEDAEDEVYPDPCLEAGMPLPPYLQESFPNKLTGTPIVDIDPYYEKKRTFIVVNRKKDIWRFNSSKSLWLYSPFHSTRRFAIFVCCHPVFIMIMLCVVLINCGLMGVRKNSTVQIIQAVFTVIYTFECIAKIVAFGFILEPFSYLRDRWNWVDLILLPIEYTIMAADIPELRAIRALRALKIIVLNPGVHTILGAIIESAKNLWGLVVVSFFAVWLLALIGLQKYMGVLTQKCIKTFSLDSLTNITEKQVEEFRENSTNWYVRKGDNEIDPLVCGNSSWAMQCPVNYTCYINYGRSPNYGYVDFNNFGYALLSTIRIMLQDTWHNLYQNIIRASGPWHVMYFILVIFIGVILFNLDFVILSSAYDDLQRRAEIEEEAEMEALRLIKMEKDMHEEAELNQTDVANGFHESSDVKKKTFRERCQGSFTRCIDVLCVWQCCECWKKFQKKLFSVAYSPCSELFICLCIVISTIILALNHHGITKELENSLMTGNYFFAVLFGIEVILKILAVSPKNYFQDIWNILETSILILSIVDGFFVALSFLPILRSIRLLRIFSLSRCWPNLRAMTSTMVLVLRCLGNLYILFVVAVFIFTVIGMESFGENYETNKHKFFDGVLPRWHFNDFSQSLMIVLGAACGKWTEAMQNCMVVSGFKCVPFFIAIVILGYLLFLIILTALIMSCWCQDVHDDEASDVISRFKSLGGFIAGCFRKCRGSTPIIHPSTNDLTDINNTRNSSGKQGSTMSMKPLLKGFGDESNDAIARHENFNAVDVEDDEADETKRAMAKRSVTSVCVAIADRKSLTEQEELCYIETAQMEKSFERVDEDTKSLNDILDTLETDMKDDPTNNGTSKKKERERITKIEEQVDEENGSEEKEDDEEQRDKELEDENHDNEKNEEDEKEGSNEELRNVEEELEIRPCCPDCCHPCSPCCLGNSDQCCVNCWSKTRCRAGVIYEHKCHQWFLLAWIVISCVALTIEDKSMEDRVVLTENVKYLDLVFELVFLFETILALFYFGCTTYFTDPWHLLDFTIHLLSMISLIGKLFECGNLYLRSLRALRPLRLLSRIRGIKRMIECLARRITTFINALEVTFVFMLIFSITGVTLFAGKFYACIDQEGKRLDHLTVPNQTICGILNYNWKNSKTNFDNVGNGFLALLQVATFAGWVDIVSNAVDSREETYLQPIRGYNVYRCIYFVIVIVFGSFFILKIFTGIVMGSLSSVDKSVLECFMTSDQKLYCNAMCKAGQRRPKKAIPRPRFKLQANFLDIIFDCKFDIIMTIIFGVHLLVMALNHYNIDPIFKETLEYINITFVAIYTIECLMKLIALRHYYFKDLWNVFDFVVVGLAIADIIAKQFRDDDFVSPILLRSINLARLIKVCRFVKGAKGIRIILITILNSLPQLAYIWFLHFIVVFVYAIFGMHFFKNLKYGGALDETFNFGTFYQSMILLFQLSSTAGWDKVLGVFMDEDNCANSTSLTENAPNCANSSVSILYLISFLIITFLIIINLYLGIVMTKFSKTTEEFYESLSDEDYDVFFEVWQMYDPDATHYISLNELSDFFDFLVPPLQIMKPNKFKIVSMDITIYKEDKVYYADVLDAVVIDYFARKGYAISHKEMRECNIRGKNAMGDVPISSTLWRQREEFCAWVIQKAWRHHRDKYQDTVVEDYVSHGGAADLPS